MSKVKVSAVSYLNTKPFIYGIQHSSLMDQIDLALDIPSVCAQKLIDGKADLGLVPVAILPLLKEYHIISDYCIGAVKPVTSVMLFSKVPVEEVMQVMLYRSKEATEIFTWPIKVLQEPLLTWK